MDYIESSKGDLVGAIIMSNLHYHQDTVEGLVFVFKNKDKYYLKRDGADISQKKYFDECYKTFSDYNSVPHPSYQT